MQTSKRFSVPPAAFAVAGEPSPSGPGTEAGTLPLSEAGRCPRCCGTDIPHLLHLAPAIPLRHAEANTRSEDVRVCNLIWIVMAFILLHAWKAWRI